MFQNKPDKYGITELTDAEWEALQGGAFEGAVIVSKTSTTVFVRDAQYNTWKCESPRFGGAAQAMYQGNFTPAPIRVDLANWQKLWKKYGGRRNGKHAYFRFTDEETGRTWKFSTKFGSSRINTECLT